MSVTLGAGALSLTSRSQNSGGVARGAPDGPPEIESPPVLAPSVTLASFPTAGSTLGAKAYDAIYTAIADIVGLSKSETVDVRGVRKEGTGFTALCGVHGFKKDAQNSDQHFLVTVNGSGVASKPLRVTVVG